MNFQTIGFIGLGLIGGSIARAIRKFHPDTQIAAFDTNLDNLTLSLSEGVITSACTKVDETFSSCDLIFLCAPVNDNNTYLPVIRKLMKPGAVLTDVGSVKSGIHQEVCRHGLESCFIGGHPMAGSEKSGYSNSNDHLIENAYYILTPAEEFPEEDAASMEAYVRSLGAIPLVIRMEEHDHIVAAVSHLPHLIAAGLVNVVKESDSPDEKMKMIAAGGFKDITRIASSSPVMWQQICELNQKPIEEMLDRYISYLSSIREMVHNRESEEIYRLFETSRDYRNSIPDNSSGPIKKVYAIYCDIIDEAGGIATIATILASNNINIRNIGIIHNRSFEEGVLRIEFYQEDACEKAAALLRKYRYTVYES
ncbi:MAG: prephenate dehydrogenase [Lachnospiraceae bacterium]|nr:prephenate dehydrogenase [Lachnospiraceae bacterium]MDD7024372.1 prephenate dehydrogenase [Oscillospiraceae bacterium]MDY5539833.1 prephenate dehydrogenase [Lachnospiraceae bacterium]MDY5648223.1 prephenate dehydrogenase [Lachnospiraceae bacterium]